MISGVCRFCGCTPQRACRMPDGGERCQWIDQEATLCSACLPRLSDEALQQLWIEEFAPLAAEPLPPVCMDAVTAFALVAALQLALKHPDVHSKTRHGAGFVRGVADAIAGCLCDVGLLTAEALRRGFVGCYEPPEPHTQSEPSRLPVE